MVVGVIALRRDAADDAPCAAIVRAGRLDSVFAVIAALLWRQGMLVIAEHDAVARIGERDRRS